MKKKTRQSKSVSKFEARKKIIWKEVINMKLNHNGKRYDTVKCVVIAEQDCYNYNNNYYGTNYLGQAYDGAWLYWQNTNEQGLWRSSSVKVVSLAYAQELVEGMKMSVDQEAEAIKQGLIVLVE